MRSTAYSAVSAVALTAAAVSAPILVTSASANTSVQERRVSNLRATIASPVRIGTALRELTHDDFVVLSEADIAMLEFAVNVEPDTLDYSAFYTDDD